MLRNRIAGVIVFACLAVLLDRAVGALIVSLYDHTSTGEGGGQLRHALENRKFDLLIFGTSRARHHVDPDVLRQELGVLAYNYGSNGRGIYYARIVERLILAKGTQARTFLLQAEPFDLYNVRPERAMICAPLVDEDPIAYDLVARATPFGHLKLYSRTYRFNSMLFPILFNLISPAPEGDVRNGFAGLVGQMTSGEANVSVANGLDIYENKPFDRLALPLYRDFIADAQRSGIRVVMFGGPWFRTSAPGNAEQRAITAFQALADAQGVTYLPLDERTFPELQDPTLYREPGHLNSDGARRLSTLLARQLSEAHILAKSSRLPQ